jgi:hypothetical protein
MNYEQFLKSVATVPPVPDTVFERVQKRVRQRNTARRFLMSAAAIVLMTIGISGFYYHETVWPVERVSAADLEEVGEELYCIEDFANGYSINNEIALYAIDLKEP